MGDLIWVGNTLYPRWFVIAVPAALVVVPFLLIGAGRLIRRGHRNWLKRPAEYDDAAGDRHLMTDAEFKDEQAARTRMFDGVEQRHYEQRMRDVDSSCPQEKKP